MCVCVCVAANAASTGSEKTAELFDDVTLANIGKQILQGLDYLHSNLYIHRDVKAGNVLLAETGCVKLGDFGVSSLLASSLTDALDRKHLRDTTKRKTADKVCACAFMHTCMYM